MYRVWGLGFRVYASLRLHCVSFSNQFVAYESCVLLSLIPGSTAPPAANTTSTNPGVVEAAVVVPVVHETPKP